MLTDVLSLAHLGSKQAIYMLHSKTHILCVYFMQNAGQLTGDHWRSQQNFKAVRSQVSQIQLSKISSDMLLTAERTLNRLDVTVFRPWREDVNTLSCSQQLVGQLFKGLMLESCGQNIFMISSCVLLHKNIMLKCGHLDVHCVS